METVAENLERMVQARQDIITAINEKGVACENTVKLSELPAKITEIKNTASVEVLGTYAGYGSKTVVGTTTMAQAGTLVLGGGFEGTSADNWVTVTVDGVEVYKYQASVNGVSFSKTIAVAAGATVEVVGNSHKTGTYGLTQCGGFMVAFVYAS
ncbi:MAG: hypothetical protein ACI4RT_09630 [Candidatus Spyradenecus sp.]